MVDVRSDFDTARQEASAEAIEELRHNYFIQARMSGSDDTTKGGLRIKAAGSKSETAQTKSKKNSVADDLLFINMLEQKYGNDFAENWAADLLDEETYSELMKIKDQDERREAIAEAIIEGLKNGTIDRENLDEKPDLQEWLKRYADRPHRTMGNAATSSETDHELTMDGSEESAFDDILSSSPGGITPS